jgi:hypothetical protein
LVTVAACAAPAAKPDNKHRPSNRFMEISDDGQGFDYEAARKPSGR